MRRGVSSTIGFRGVIYGNGKFIALGIDGYRITFGRWNSEYITVFHVTATD